MDTIRLAWRNLWRNGRRTAVTMAATALALFTMIVYSGLVDGYLANLQSQVVDVDMGEVQVHHSEYRNKPSLYGRMEQVDDKVAKLQAAGFRAAPRLLASGLVAAGDNSAGAKIIGVDAELDKTVSAAYERVTSGAWLEADQSHEVVLGAKLAKSLGATIGDEIVVLSQAADGSTANDLYRVRGLVSKVSEEVDRGGVYMLQRDFRDLFVVDDGAHQLIVRSPAKRELVAATRQVKAMFPDDDVENWRGLNPTLAQMIDGAQAGMMMMFGIIYMAIAIVVFNATLMAVFERIREFGVLKAIGYSPRAVMAMILSETAMQTLLASMIGTLLSLPAVHYLATTGIDLAAMGNMGVGGVSMASIWKAEVSAQTFTTPIIALVMIILLATLYPAARAAFVRPVEAMRHQ